MADLRIGLYGLTADELEQADSLGLSAWDFAEAYKGAGDSLKPLSDAEKRSAWKALFEERLQEHAKDLKIWMDGDGKLWLGRFRRDSLGVQWIIIIALMQFKSQSIVAVPLRREATDAVTGVAWWRPWMGQGVWEKIRTWRRIVPPGVF